MTYDELQGLTYLQVKGSGIANTCPVLEGGSSNLKDLKAGNYSMSKFCLEPTSFTVKEESQFKGGEPEFVKTKLMTRLTYTLDEVRNVLFSYHLCLQQTGTFPRVELHAAIGLFWALHGQSQGVLQGCVIVSGQLGHSRGQALRAPKGQPSYCPAVTSSHGHHMEESSHRGSVQ